MFEKIPMVDIWQKGTRIKYQVLDNVRVVKAQDIEQDVGIFSQK